MTTTYTPSAFDAGNPVYTVTTFEASVVQISATTSLGGRVFDVAPDGAPAEVSNDGSSPA